MVDASQPVGSNLEVLMSSPRASRHPVAVALSIGLTLGTLFVGGIMVAGFLLEGGHQIDDSPSSIVPASGAQPMPAPTAPPPGATAPPQR
jgi:hypothetical protein